MKRMFINLLVYLLISSYQLKSQTLYSVDKWMEYIEEMASETEDEERIEALYTDLSYLTCLLYTSPSPRDLSTSRMPSSA